MIKTESIDHLTLIVKDVKISKKFYQKVCGMKVIFDEEDVCGLTDGTFSLWLALSREKSKKDFNPENLNYMMTCSRLVYMPAGQKDKVVHGYGYPDPVEEVLDFVGPSGLEITDKSNLENEIEALLGTQNLERVHQVYETLTGKKPKLWRLSSKPTSKDERALVLGCYGSFDVIAYDLIISYRPARGSVARRAQKNFHRK